jgi:DNA-binding NarL/FixJ family response regulator
MTKRHVLPSRSRPRHGHGSSGRRRGSSPRGHASLDAIRRVHAGDTLLPPQITAKLAQRVTDESLTDREREVLTLVAEGRSNREIGSEIHIEESTVKTHLKSIFAKLHAESRTEAVTVATRRGLLRHSGSL